MNGVDIIIVAALVYFVYHGAQNGLIGELLGITSWLLAAMVALRFGEWAADRITGYTHLPSSLTVPLGYIVVLLAFRVVIQMFLYGVKKAVDPKTHDAMNKFLGAAVGFIKGAFLVSIFLLAISIMPLGDKVRQYEKESVLFPHFTQFAGKIMGHVIKALPQTQPSAPQAAPSPHKTI